MTKFWFDILKSSKKRARNQLKGKKIREDFERLKETI